MKTLIQTLAASLKTHAAPFVADTRGATAIEYALIAVGLSIVIITTVFLVGDELDEMFTEVVNDYLAQRG